ncbi:hypothetical protein N7466_001585 [Penicillium verhagenii]|uniref:uncharacterized protein n=1 Tax=Penicillium verhagenii TaxID=1562060 RepID=UPI002544DC58|nr:uncharacterized protein N7466_001585 [Penicillium verhagenii]KAJ5938451.1 hypothetical protein N7466_001585 [Penicillium verhagenii]
MSLNFTPNNRYLQVGVNLGNIFTCAEPSSVTHSEDTTVSKVRGGIDAATRLALYQALVKAQRYLNMIQHDVSQHTQVVRVVEQLGSLLLNLKSLQPDQWGSLDRGVISNVLSLLYCCIMECYELLSTPLVISSPCDGLVACHLALQCVYGATLMDLDGRNSQQQKVIEALEQLGNKRAKYRNEAEQPGPALYHSQAVLDALRRICEQDRAMSSGGVHISFDGENRGIRIFENHGSMGRNFPL